MSLHPLFDPDHIEDNDVVPVWDYLESLGVPKDDIKKVVGFLVLKTLALPKSEIHEGASEIGLTVFSEGPTFES